MNRGLGSTARVWAVPVATVCALVVVVAPSLLVIGAPESTPLALALVTVALAALLRVDLRSVAIAAAGKGGTTRLIRHGASPVPTDRVTDPTHHPLRPRAPGTA